MLNANEDGVPTPDPETDPGKGIGLVQDPNALEVEEISDEVEENSNGN